MVSLAGNMGSSLGGSKKKPGGPMVGSLMKFTMGAMKQVGESNARAVDKYGSGPAKPLGFKQTGTPISPDSIRSAMRKLMGDSQRPGRRQARGARSEGQRTSGSSAANTAKASTNIDIPEVNTRPGDDRRTSAGVKKRGKQWFAGLSASGGSPGGKTLLG